MSIWFYLSGKEEGGRILIEERPQDGRADVHAQGRHLVQILGPEKTDLALRLPRIQGKT